MPEFDNYYEALQLEHGLNQLNRAQNVDSIIEFRLTEFHERDGGIEEALKAHQQTGRRTLKNCYAIPLLPESFSALTSSAIEHVSDISIHGLLESLGARQILDYDGLAGINFKDWIIEGVDPYGQPNGRNEFIRVTHQPGLEGQKSFATLYFDIAPPSPADIVGAPKPTERSAGFISKLLNKLHQNKFSS